MCPCGTACLCDIACGFGVGTKSLALGFRVLFLTISSVFACGPPLVELGAGDGVFAVRGDATRSGVEDALLFGSPEGLPGGDDFLIS